MTKKMQLIFVTVFTIWNSARAQSYSVESFEGHATKIRITNYSTDNSRYGAKISCVTDSLFLTDYNGMNEAHVIKFNVTGNDQSNFKLLANVYDRHKSSSSPKQNYIRNKKVTLNYDSSRNIFFTAYKSITQSFTVNDPKTQQSNKQQISGLLPIVALGSQPYYYIKGQWYAKGYDDDLFKEYYR